MGGLESAQGIYSETINNGEKTVYSDFSVEGTYGKSWCHGGTNAWNKDASLPVNLIIPIKTGKFNDMVGGQSFVIEDNKFPTKIVRRHL